MTTDNSKEIFVLDGGFGSLLEKLGYSVDKHELWSGGANIDRPDLVLKAHQLFINAGADIIETNTYHCCLKKLFESVSQIEAENIIKKAVEIAKTAIETSNSLKTIKLVGSIGPYATYFRDASEYTGAYTKKSDFNSQTIINYYLIQARPLINAGIRHLVFETIPTLVEVDCVIKVLKILDEQIDEAWVGVSCQNGLETRGGDLFVDVVQLLNKVNKISHIGINCTAPQHITQLLESASKEYEKNSKPYVLYPNSGEVYNIETRKFEGDVELDLITNLIPTWYKLGARIFGGCCRILPEHIQKIAKICHQLKEAEKKIQ